jgi:hypothetical protein
MENERKIEVLVIMAFIVFIVLIIFILLLIIKGTTTNKFISNSGKSSGVSYNYYNLTTINNYPSSIQGKIITTSKGNKDVIQKRVVDNAKTIVVYKDKYYSNKDYNDERSIFNNNRENLKYSIYTRHIKEKDELGSYDERFDVYVKNQDSVGGYFEVTFNFEDCYGEKFTEALTKYIKPRETEKFEYMEIWYKDQGICDWDYDVFS